jgi:hypothetical protein
LNPVADGERQEQLTCVIRKPVEGYKRRKRETEALLHGLIVDNGEVRDIAREEDDIGDERNRNASDTSDEQEK